MNKKFELWLDESGDFKNQAELRDSERKGSLVGGFLIDKKLSERIDWESLIEEGRGHATELPENDKRDYVLPILESLKERGAIQVFFENSRYKDGESSTQLYLNIMAEGLLQLLTKLDAMYESVDMEVFIAQRQEVNEESRRRINEDEYVDMIRTVLDRKKILRRALFDNRTQIRFKIDSANAVKKLQLADFCCNTRLTRDSRAFGGVRDRVYALYENAYIFTLTEKSSVNYINRCLINKNVSDAILELYTTVDRFTEETREEILSQIISNLKNCSYRIQKSQLKQCRQDMAAYTQNEDDYSVLAEKYVLIYSELIPRLEQHSIPCLEFKFMILMNLSDSLLRGGNIIRARKVLEECKKIQSNMDDSLETLLSYHQLIEKEALLLIDEYDFDSAVRLLEKAKKMYEAVMERLSAVEIVGERYPSLKSEYYGDLLCMEIYAMMFLQREDPSLYDRMTELSDLAMSQYPDQEGELERNLQYRSHIEMEAGNYEEALYLLFCSVPFDSRDISDEALYAFIEKICNTHQSIGCQYYLMYYLLILSEAKLHGRDELADRMFLALRRQGGLMAYGRIDRNEPDVDMTNINIRAVAHKRSGKVYHPMEVIVWKYATYLMCEGRYETADRYYSLAMAYSYAESENDNLQITGLAICAERIYMRIKSGDKKAAKEHYGELRANCERLLGKEFGSATKELIQRISDQAAEALADGTLDKEKIYGITRMITY